MSINFQSMLGLSNLDAQTINTDNLSVDTVTINNLTIAGGTTGNILTKDSDGGSSWQPEAEANLAGDCTGPASSNSINILGNGTIPVNTLVQLDATQTVTNKTFVNALLEGNAGCTGTLQTEELALLRSDAAYGKIMTCQDLDGNCAWETVPTVNMFSGVYSPFVTYAIGNRVSYELTVNLKVTTVYVSLANGNLNNQPDISPSYWQKEMTGFRDAGAQFLALAASTYTTAQPNSIVLRDSTGSGAFNNITANGTITNSTSQVATYLGMGWSSSFGGGGPFINEVLTNIRVSKSIDGIVTLQFPPLSPTAIDTVNAPDIPSAGYEMLLYPWAIPKDAEGNATEVTHRITMVTGTDATEGLGLIKITNIGGVYWFPDKSVGWTDLAGYYGFSMSFMT